MKVKALVLSPEYLELVRKARSLLKLRPSLETTAAVSTWRASAKMLKSSLPGDLVANLGILDEDLATAFPDLV